MTGVAHPDITGRRLYALFELMGGKGRVVVAPLPALLQKVLPRRILGDVSQYLVAGEEVERQALVEKLVRLGYANVPLVEDWGTFSVRGGILDIFPPNCRPRSGSTFSAILSIPSGPWPGHTAFTEIPGRADHPPVEGGDPDGGGSEGVHPPSQGSLRSTGNHCYPPPGTCRRAEFRHLSSRMNNCKPSPPRAGRGVAGIRYREDKWRN